MKIKVSFAATLKEKKLKNFSELGLSSNIMRVLPELGYQEPSPIQEQAIPVLSAEMCDFIGLAQTGTGKTAAFGLPMLDWIDPKLKETQALVLAPTRELGQQIANQLELFSKYMSSLKLQAVYGGASIVTQMSNIKRNTPHIVIATPGRLLDLIRRKSLDLSSVKLVVLDEADEMLNMGFKEDIDQILSRTGDNKRTWLFSATMPKEIRGIVNSYMNEPSEVKVSTGNQLNENIEHQYAVVKSSEKFEGLKRILDSESNFRGVIFCRTRIKTQQLADDLKKSNYQAEALHGDLSQAQRDRVMGRFKKHHLQVLVATDVAARGIDVSDLTHVIHYALPDDPSYYTHRSGRTARAGKKGISLCILTSRDMRKLDYLEKQLKIKLNKISIPNAMDVLSQRMKKWTDDLLNTPINKKLDGQLLTEIQMQLGSLSFEELVEKLVSYEIKQLNFNPNNKDLNESSSASRRKSTKDSSKSKGRMTSSDKRKSKSNRETKSNKKGDVKFFINVGKVDGVSRKDLHEFLCDTARLKKNEIGNIDLQKTYSYFEVNKKSAKFISNKFDGIFIDGRELRVNREHQK